MPLAQRSGGVYNETMQIGGELVAERIGRLIAAYADTLKASPSSVEAVFLYGSSLDRLFRPDSDIDIAVLDRAEDPLTWSEQARLMDGLERATGRAVDLRMLRESSLAHQAHVVEHGQILWMRNPGEVERFSRRVLAAARDDQERSKREWPRVLERLVGLAASR
jgi:predicted nucleotidyltransferase